MSDRKLLMPKATAVWLVENTSLTFEQIAELCELHVLEVKGIADGDVAQGIKGMDPISTGQLTREEIARGEEDHGYRLRLAAAKVDIPEVKTKKGPRYTPVSRRQDRPNAVLWLLRSHAELKDSQIMRLVGTTKPTIAAIRERTHWNSPNLQPQDPVTLGLCSQIDLDNEVKKAARRVERERKEQGKPPLEKAGTLLPASHTIPGHGAAAGCGDRGAEARRGEARGDRARGRGARVRPAARDGRHQDRGEAAGIGLPRRGCWNVKRMPSMPGRSFQPSISAPLAGGRARTGRGWRSGWDARRLHRQLVGDCVPGRAALPHKCTCIDDRHREPHIRSC